MKVTLSCSLCLILSVSVAAFSDPTRPDVAVTSPQSVSATGALDAVQSFKLGLIKNVQGQYMALVNGRAVRQGDEIEGYQVLTITNQQVVLQKQNERLTLNLFKAMKTQ